MTDADTTSVEVKFEDARAAIFDESFEAVLKKLEIEVEIQEVTEEKFVTLGFSGLRDYVIRFGVGYVIGISRELKNCRIYLHTRDGYLIGSVENLRTQIPAGIVGDERVLDLLLNESSAKRFVRKAEISAGDNATTLNFRFGDVDPISWNIARGKSKYQDLNDIHCVHDVLELIDWKKIPEAQKNFWLALKRQDSAAKWLREHMRIVRLEGNGIKLLGVGNHGAENEYLTIFGQDPLGILGKESRLNQRHAMNHWLAVTTLFKTHPELVEQLITEASDVCRIYVPGVSFEHKLSEDGKTVSFFREGLENYTCTYDTEDMLRIEVDDIDGEAHREFSNNLCCRELGAMAGTLSSNSVRGVIENPDCMVGKIFVDPQVIHIHLPIGGQGGFLMYIGHPRNELHTDCCWGIEVKRDADGTYSTIEGYKYNERIVRARRYENPVFISSPAQ